VTSRVINFEWTGYQCLSSGIIFKPNTNMTTITKRFTFRSPADGRVWLVCFANKAGYFPQVGILDQIIGTVWQSRDKWFSITVHV